MADNLLVTPGIGATVAADDIAGALHQRIKLTWGVDGSAVDTSASNPLPVTSVVTSLPALATGANVIGAVTQSGTWNIGSITTLPALATGGNVIGGVTQSGTWNVNNISGTISLPTGASTAANQTTLNTNVGSSADAILTAGNAGSLASYMRTVMEQSLSAAASAVDLTKIGGNTIAAGAGVVGTGVIRTTQASDSPLVAAFGTAGTAKTYAGTFNVAASALTRPANTTAYTALDSISNNATAGSVTANSVSLSDTNDHPIDIAEILLTSTDTGPGTAAIQIRCHLFNSDPTASTGVVGGDNAAWSNKQAGWVGSFSGTMRAFSDGSRGVLIADEGTLRLMNPVSGAKTIYWQLQTIGAFTPSANSTTFTPTFKGFQARTA